MSYCSHTGHLCSHSHLLMSPCTKDFMQVFQMLISWQSLVKKQSYMKHGSMGESFDPIDTNSRVWLGQNTGQ